MKKLLAPQFNAMDTFDCCVESVSNLVLKARYVESRLSIEQADADFVAFGQNATWCNLPRSPRGNGDAIVAGTLTKNNLTDLYSKHMVGTTGPSRAIYDKIFTAAGGFCPFCGGLGHVYTLDHYLPKAYFPKYSVHPANLVPCCLDCNMGKNASFGQFTNEQMLHPYLDHDQFFNERWMSASAYPGESILIRFDCTPPEAWALNDKQRVQSHFVGYNLHGRFSLQAGSEVPRLVNARANSLQTLSVDSYREFLLETANDQNLVINGWQRTLYSALADTDWFVQTDFRDPFWYIALVPQP